MSDAEYDKEEGGEVSTEEADEDFGMATIQRLKEDLLADDEGEERQGACRYIVTFAFVSNNFF